MSQDPYLESSFAVELTTYEGTSLGYFSTLTGGSMSVVVVEHTLLYPEGGSRGIYIPSATNFEPITLSFGVTDDMDFWDWWADMANGYRNRIDASIFAIGPSYTPAPSTSPISESSFDSEGNIKPASARIVPAALKAKQRRLAQWDLEDVWPSRISGFNFDADSNRYYLASVTLVAEDIKRVPVNNS